MLAIELLQEGDTALLGRYSLLALVQGLTEFLPVSSSGHLVLTQAVLGFEAAPPAVDVALHVGTLVAVLVVYRSSIVGLLGGLRRGAFREPLLLLLATVPVAVVGLLFEGAITHSFEDPRLVARALLGTAAILLVGDWGRRRKPGNPKRGVEPSESGTESEKQLTIRSAAIIGTAQCLALLPGISRSGTTIATGLLLGLSPAYAARVSFLLSIPAIAGAAILALPDLELGSGNSGAILAWAMLLAALVGWVALRVLLRFLNRGAFVWFAAYCAMLGVGYLAFG